MLWGPDIAAISQIFSDAGSFTRRNNACEHV